jgi:hypothetical protein
MHLEQVANQCIQAGVCLDDIYIRLMLTKKGQGRVPTPMPVRNRPIETVGDLRAAIAELPDDMRLIKTPEFRRVTEQLGLMCRRQAGG